MKNKIQRMVNDITAIDPSLSAKGKELEKIIGRLLSSKPQAEMNKSFRNTLRQEIGKRLKKISPSESTINPARAFFNWFKIQRLRLAAAASVFSLLLITAVTILPLFLQYQTDKQAVEKEEAFEKQVQKATPEKQAEGDLNLGRLDLSKSDTSLKTAAEEKPALPSSAKKKESKASIVATNDKKPTRALIELDTGKDSRERNDVLIRPPGTEGQIPLAAEDSKITDDAAKTELPVPIEKEEETTITGLLSEKAASPSEGVEMKAEEKQKKIITTGTEDSKFDFEQGFLDSAKSPLSTFPLNVGTASYPAVRSYLENGKLPPPDAVRIEELVNYFDYRYPPSSLEHPISLFSEIAECPWNAEHKLLLIGIRAKGPDKRSTPSGDQERDKAFSHEGEAQGPIAEEVQIQVEFNPLSVHSYRLLGYENLLLDTPDLSGKEYKGDELRSGQTLTVLYEIVPEKRTATFDNFKTQPGEGPEMAILNLRYKKPDQETSLHIAITAYDENRSLSSASDNFRLAAAVAEWGLLLKDSPHKGNANYAQVRELAGSIQGKDPLGRRTEFLKLMELSIQLEATQ